VSVVYLTIDEVLKNHTFALTLGNGGLDGVRSQQVLASAVNQPQQSAFGDDAYPTIPEKAAAYAYFIAEGQPFIDGNKRTAALTMLMFLDLNEYDLIEGGDEELAVMLEDLGSKTIDQSEFFGWVLNHARKREPLADVLPFNRPTGTDE
jgi:death-on-curing protein